ncbi:endonuclease/exonuclease/phosphatase family protein [Octadecabacter sp. 1_MG-2023]|uniref:endonuclease/exonuclease/phosphatase family protein n=1 Tax=unclassified Octadecabacter TaxID=196158 RepID=UPI001C09F9E6|nr:MULTISPECIES: endonuclease/exonuclease/phosphatase family protein [unclassified Octadecabacter]MBU2993732.1 endonuclease/exonuclease/phosphatase family protein [Octadecabacter sp. B2R22]MDO6735423.1 endonuclease/exonuclease/phosphatase family protein [Octadecabacter sp. 1_MG-2023]
MWQLIGRSLVICAGIVLAMSFAGDVHGLGDSLAVFRLWIAFGLALASALAFAVGCKLIGPLGLIMGTGVVVRILLMFFVEIEIENDRAFDLLVYSKNTLGGRGDDAAVVADIQRAAADIVLLQEVSATRSDYANDLMSTHPHAHFCQFSDWSGIGIVARWPIEQNYCSPSRSIAAARILGPNGPFWAVSVHLVWPYPYDQQSILAQALPFLAEIDGRVLVGGDFNMAPWGASVRQIANATETALHGPLQTTLRIRNIPFQIDHVLSTGEGQVTTRPLFGSDHHGVLAEIDWGDD